MDRKTSFFSLDLLQFYLINDTSNSFDAFIWLNGYQMNIKEYFEIFSGKPGKIKRFKKKLFFDFRQSDLWSKFYEDWLKSCKKKSERKSRYKTWMNNFNVFFRTKKSLFSSLCNGIKMKPLFKIGLVKSIYVNILKLLLFCICRFRTGWCQWICKYNSSSN